MQEKLKVLLIEDSLDDAELVLRFVKKFAKNIYFERVQTEEELKNVSAREQWDLILSDYNLPSFSGLEALRILKEAESEVPVILVSGTIGEETAVEALKAGASDYVLKSNLGRLTTAIEHAMRAKQAEVENRKLTKQLEQAQKMEAVGRLAGGIAHDVNNALAAMTIYAEMAVEQIDSGELEPAKESLQGVLRSQESAAGIIRQLLSFSRKNLEPPRVVDFCANLQRISPLIRTLLGEDIKLTVESSSEPIQVLADPTQIEQTVMNLAVNARDAMAPGGNFTLSLSRITVDHPPADARLPVGPGEYACLSARDTGCGMTPEIVDQVFEPFFTTKKDGKGTGLGLSVVYGIIKQAKGSLLVDSQVGRGTEFKVLWPIANSDQKAEGVNAKAAAARALPKNDTHILLVEDEEVLRCALVAALRKRGYEVVEAPNGVEALKIISDKKVPVNLLITDMVMPQMGGPELAKKVREKIPNIGILFLSGYADETLEEYPVDVALTWFLQKPFTTNAFVDKVVEVAAGKNSLLRKGS